MRDTFWFAHLLRCQFCLPHIPCNSPWEVCSCSRPRCSRIFWRLGPHSQASRMHSCVAFQAQAESIGAALARLFPTQRLPLVMGVRHLTLYLLSLFRRAFQVGTWNYVG